MEETGAALLRSVGVSQGKLVLLMEDNAPLPGPVLGAGPGRRSTGECPMDRPLAMRPTLEVTVVSKPSYASASAWKPTYISG